MVDVNSQVKDIDNIIFFRYYNSEISPKHCRQQFFVINMNAKIGPNMNIEKSVKKKKKICGIKTLLLESKII